MPTKEIRDEKLYPVLYSGLGMNVPRLRTSDGGGLPPPVSPKAIRSHCGVVPYFVFFMGDRILELSYYELVERLTKGR